MSYLHTVSRLDDFVNLGSFFPYRTEISDYLRWVAASLSHTRVEFGRRCVGIEPLRDAGGILSGWLARLGDGSAIRCRYLVLGGGRDAHVPPAFAGLPQERVIHSTSYRSRIRALEGPLRVAVIGGAQSAAEMFQAVQSDLPGCRPTMIMRSIGLNGYESSRFTNELFYPSFVDEFFTAQRTRASSCCARCTGPTTPGSPRGCSTASIARSTSTGSTASAGTRSGR
jgi:L-ornithine N5-oxygenase